MDRKAGVLAIDHGTKRAGFAVVDALRIAARALEGWRGKGDGEELLDHVARLLEDRDVSVLLVGLPISMDGSEGPRAADVRAFASRLAARFPGCDVVLHDERLTTKTAEEMLREMGAGIEELRARKDSFSALVLLRDWIAAGEPR